MKQQLQLHWKSSKLSMQQKTWGDWVQQQSLMEPQKCVFVGLMMFVARWRCCTALELVSLTACELSAVFSSVMRDDCLQLWGEPDAHTVLLDLMLVSLCSYCRSLIYSQNKALKKICSVLRRLRTASVLRCFTMVTAAVTTVIVILVEWNSVFNNWWILTCLTHVQLVLLCFWMLLFMCLCSCWNVIFHPKLKKKKKW